MAVHGEDMHWGLAEHLLAVTIDVLNTANWQRGGGRQGRRPKPIPRPGVQDSNVTRLTGRVQSIASMRAFLDRRKAQTLELEAGGGD